jgi:hypothetical protein
LWGATHARTHARAVWLAGSVAIAMALASGLDAQGTCIRKLLSKGHGVTDIEVSDHVIDPQYFGRCNAEEQLEFEREPTREPIHVEAVWSRSSMSALISKWQSSQDKQLAHITDTTVLPTVLDTAGAPAWAWPRPLHTSTCCNQQLVIQNIVSPRRRPGPAVDALHWSSPYWAHHHTTTSRLTAHMTSVLSS